MMTVGAVSMHATDVCTVDSDGKTTDCHDVNNRTDKPLKRKKGSSSPMVGTSSATDAPLSFTASEDFADENQTEGNYFPSSKTATINNYVFNDVEESIDQHIDGKVQIGYLSNNDSNNFSMLREYLHGVLQQ
ncbi:hypothetical protein [Candidatus Chromulinivorax destructor]|nr:hypothetical protein [Candidatus Chromulinivorax destructor]